MVSIHNLPEERAFFMPNQVIITSDSSADLPPGVREEFGIHYMPIIVQVEGRSGQDCMDIFPEEIYAAFRERGALPKTAAQSPAAYQEFFEGFTRQGCAVVHISLNAKFSSCYQNACLAAAQAEGEVHVVDSRNFCTGQGMLCVQAARLRDAGRTAAEIAGLLEEQRSKVWALYYLDGLDFLSKSGRCPALLAIGASLLSLHPAVLMDGATGDVVIGKKYRGKSAAAAEAWLRDAALRFFEACDPSLCFFMRTPDIPPTAYEPMNRLAAELLQGAGRVVMEPVGCTIVSHVGGNCFAVVGMER